MSSLLRRSEFYIAIMIVVAMTIFIPFYIETPETKSLASEVSKWTSVMAGFYIIYGGVTMYRSHIKKVSRKTEGWMWSIWLLFWLTLTTVVGISSIWSPASLDIFRWIANNINAPLNSTMYALLFFFVISATVKSFTFRSTEVTIIILTTVIYYLRFTPAIYAIAPWAAVPGEFLVNTMAPAGKMAREIGQGVIMLGMGARALLGIERTWLGRAE